MDIVIPNGGSDPERDLHAAAFYSKVGAFAGVFQVLQNQRTNQLLEGQLLMQGHIQLQAQLDELRSAVQSQLENHVEGFSYLKSLCQSASGTWLGMSVKEDLLRTFEAVNDYALSIHEQLEDLLEVIDEIRAPEDFVAVHQAIAKCSQDNQQYAAVASNLGEKASLMLDYDESSKRVNELDKTCDEMWDQIHDLLQKDEALADWFNDEIEIEDRLTPYNEAVSGINQCAEVFKQMWSSSDRSIIEAFYSHFNEAESIMLEHKKFSENVLERINNIRDGVAVKSARASKSSNRKSVKTRLKELQSLLNDGLISQKEFELKREEILRSV